MTTRIFVTGSTGYIGLEVASTLRRAGHKVYGLVRSEDKAKALRQNEIIPVLGNIDQPDTYCEALAKCSVVIDTVLDFSNPFAGNLKLLEASGEGALQKKKLFIYTSGCLVHGSGKEIVDEDTIERTPLPPLLKRRVEFENAVLSSSKVRCPYNPHLLLIARVFLSYLKHTKFALNRLMVLSYAQALSMVA